MEPYYAYIRLVNNVDLIGIIKTENSSGFTIEKPVEMSVDIDKTRGVPVTMFYAWLPIASLNTDSVSIGRDKVLFALPLNQNMVDKLRGIIQKCYKIQEIAESALHTKPNLDLLEDLLNGASPDKKN
jgi:hypothetical protein